MIDYPSMGHKVNLCNFFLHKLFYTPEKRYAEAELCKLLPGYKKSHYNVSSIIVNLERALKNEKAFCETIEELVCNVGSNVGLLIQEMRLIGYKK